MDVITNVLAELRLKNRLSEAQYMLAYRISQEPNSAFTGDRSILSALAYCAFVLKDRDEPKATQLLQYVAESCKKYSYTKYLFQLISQAMEDGWDNAVNVISSQLSMTELNSVRTTYWLVDCARQAGRAAIAAAIVIAVYVIVNSLWR